MRWRSRRSSRRGRAASDAVRQDGSAGRAGHERGPRHGAEVTLSLWFQPNGLEPLRLMRAELDRFERAHPHIRVEPRMIAWDQTLTKLATATRSGAVPDVAFIGSAWVADLSVDRAFHVFTDAQLDRIAGPDAFHQASWTTGVVGGQVIGIPWLVDTRLLFYRRDLLERAGVDPTRDLADWEAFERSLARLDDRGETSPWAIPGRNDWSVVHNALAWIWASGGSPLGADGSSTLASPETLRGLSELQRLVDRYGAPEALRQDSDTLQWSFVSGKVAMTVSGPWLAQNLRNHLDDEQWGAVPLPSGPGGTATLVGGSHLTVYKDGPAIEAAVDLVAFLSSTSSQERMASATSMLPSRVAAQVVGAEAEAAQRALAAADPFPRAAGWMEIEHALQRSFSRLWASVEQGAPLSRSELIRLLEDASTQVSESLSRGVGV